MSETPPSMLYKFMVKFNNIYRDMKRERKQNIELRGRGNTVGSLTQKQKSIIIGSLLGDGYLRIVPGRKNAFLEINHSVSEKNYVDWQYQRLKDIVKSPPKQRKGGGRRIAFRFFTQQHPELTKLYLKFYKDGKKTIPNLKLDPLMIAVWFMDDGSKCGKDYYLNCQRFDLISQKRLMEMLNRQYGISTSLNRDKKYYRIRVRRRSQERFKKLIESYIIPSMRYKVW